MHLWFWAWVILAVLFALAESITGGLLVLPWAFGAAAAALLEALGVAIGWQWLVFIGLSSLLVVAAQRLIIQRRQ